MQFELLDESHYAEIMNTTVVPALESCRVEGWMEASPSLQGHAPHQNGKLHYVCYPAEDFDGLHRSEASARLRGVVVISHGFTEFAEKYDEWSGISSWPGTPYACWSIAGTASR
jgi:lysophospholipase